MEVETEYVKHHEVLKALSRWNEAWPCPLHCDWYCFVESRYILSWARDKDGDTVFGYSPRGARRIRLIANSPHWLAILKAIAVQYMENQMTIKEVTMEQANQLMYDAIKRWQRAMKEISAYQHPFIPTLEEDEKRKKLWDELSNAEHDLMDI